MIYAKTSMGRLPKMGCMYIQDEDGSNKKLISIKRMMLELPISCYKCPYSKVGDMGVKWKCALIERRITSRLRDERAEFCPLKIIKERDNCND